MIVGRSSRVLVVAVALLTVAAAAEAQRGGGGGRRPAPGPGPGAPPPPAAAPDTPAPAGGEFGTSFPEAMEAFNRGQGRQALAAYERMAAEAEGRGAKLDAARAHAAIAFVAQRLGMFQKTIRSGVRALELFKAESPTNETVGRMISLYSHLGSAYRAAGDRIQARRYFEEGLAFARSYAHLRGATGLGVGVLSRQLAQLALGEADYATAETAGLEAVQFFEAFLAKVPPRAPERLKENARRQAAEAFMLVARAQLNLKRLDDAEAALKQASGYARLVGIAEQEIDLLGIAAGVAQARGDFARALDLNQQGIAVARRVNKTSALINLTQGAARNQLALGRLDEALASVRTSMDLVEEVRSELQESDLRSGFLEDKQRLYHLAVAVALKAGQPAEAFAFAERGRARAFLDLLGNQTTLSKGKTRALVQEELRLRARLAEVRATIQDEGDGGSARGRLEEADREYRAFLERVRKESLEQASLMSVDPVVVKDIQALLPEGTTLLEYFVGDRELVVWIIDRHRVKALTLRGARAGLVKDVRDFRAAIADRAPLEKIEPLARALHDRLLAAARADIRGGQLLIVPHDVLHYLPFAALRSAAGTWLMQDYALATLPSASVLKFLVGKGGDAGTRVLAVGNPDVGVGLNLRYAEREARLVGQRYAGATVLVRRAATEADAKKLLPDAGLIHFAMHGELNEADPLSSALLMVPGEGDDGRLEVRELFGLDLHARLVVLSACETGLGKLSRGDELVGLQRAFLYAGTPAVVTTLWKVDDRASYELMREFYDRLATARPAEALRASQQAVLQHFPHPFAWAAFGVTGAPW